MGFQINSSLNYMLGLSLQLIIEVVNLLVEYSLKGKSKKNYNKKREKKRFIKRKKNKNLLAQISRGSSMK